MCVCTVQSVFKATPVDPSLHGRAMKSWSVLSVSDLSSYPAWMQRVNGKVFAMTIHFVLVMLAGLHSCGINIHMLLHLPFLFVAMGFYGLILPFPLKDSWGTS